LEAEIMRNAVPMRWIEQREARQVLTAALFEQVPDAPWSSGAGDVAAHILPGLRSWLAARHPMGCAAGAADPGVETAGRLGVPKRWRGGGEQ
jgi:hypothetical protein